MFFILCNIICLINIYDIQCRKMGKIFFQNVQNIFSTSVSISYIFLLFLLFEKSKCALTHIFCFYHGISIEKNRIYIQINDNIIKQNLLNDFKGI